MKITKKIIKEIDFWALMLAILLSGLMAFGVVDTITPDEVSVTATIRRHLAVFIVLGLFSVIVLQFSFNKLFRWIDSISEKRERKERLLIPNLKQWGKVAVLILICWMPYLIVCYPCITRGYDYFWQLMQGTGVFPLSNHHPVFGSLVFGLLFKLGYILGGASFGLFFSAMAQAVALSASAGFSIACIGSDTCVPKGIYRSMIAAICICPVFPGHAAWLIKDSLFTACGILFFTEVYIRIRAEETNADVPIIASYPAIVITGVVFSLFRNGTTPVVLMTLFVLLYYEIKNRRIIGEKYKNNIAALIIFLISIVLWNTAMTAMNVYPTDKREALAMPTRQIIRTIQMHPDSVSDDIYGVLETAYHEQLADGYTLEDIIGRYDKMNVDYIKIDYVQEDSFISSYIKIWLSLGLQHPGSYLDAFMRGTDGYWYPLKPPHIEALGNIVHAVVTPGPENDFANETMRERQLSTLFLPTVKSLEAVGYDTDQTFEDLFQQYPWLEDLMHVKSAFPNGRFKIEIALAKIEDIPAISMILAPGTYCWIMLICFAYLFSRKKEGRFLWPILMIELLAWLSPVNGYPRYILLIDCFSIIMIGMCFSKGAQDAINDINAMTE